MTFFLLKIICFKIDFPSAFRIFFKIWCFSTWINISQIADLPKWERLFLWVISWFESLQDTKRWNWLQGLPCPLASPKCFCQSTFRYFPLPSTVCLKVDCSAEQMLLRFCQQLSAQPPYRQLDNGFRKVGWGWRWGCALISYLPALCQKWWSIAIASLKLIFALFETKEWVFLIYYLKIHISKNQARLLSTQRCLPQESCRC